MTTAPSSSSVQSPSGVLATTSPHQVTWVLDADGVHGSFHCHAPVGWWCRVWCDEGCEETCSGDVETGRPHRTKDHGECLVAAMFEGFLYEYFDGTPTAPRDGAVVLSWNGDMWVWSYGDAGAPAEVACRACGCIESRACAGGCFWVEPDLCSACAAAQDAAAQCLPPLCVRPKGHGGVHVGGD